MIKSELEKLIELGWSTRQIAKHFGKSQTATRYTLTKFNLKTERVEKNIGGHPYKKDVYDCLCGESDPNNFYPSRRVACKKCHNEYTTTVSNDKRARIIAHMGGECKNCGWNLFQSGFQVHHLDPSKKDINFHHHRGWSWDRILKEINGCVLLCACCHIGFHAGDVELIELNVVP